MKLKIKKSGDISILSLKSNRLDSKLATELKSRVVILDTEEDNDLVIDVSSITFTDSSGLGSLLLAQRLYRDNGRRLVLVGITNQVRKLLEISKLNDVFVSVENTDAALEYLGTNGNN
ncbi:MAG: STAS domain-containing protein [Balneolales bacterium]